MSDTAHNTLVTILLILVVIVAIILFSGRRIGPQATYYYYPASASVVGRGVPSYNQQSVVTYSRASTPIKSSTSTVYTYDYAYATPSTIACPMDAMLCPDGSYVGRVGNNCEFATCPSY